MLGLSVAFNFSFHHRSVKVSCLELGTNVIIEFPEFKLDEAADGVQSLDYFC